MRKLCLSVILSLSFLTSINSQPVLYAPVRGRGESTINKFDAANNSLTAVYRFTDNGVGNEFNSIVEADNGKFYGTIGVGGRYGSGMIYSVDPATGVYTKIRDFGINEGNAYGGLTKGTDGKLYGTTSYGNRYGMLYSFDPSTYTFIVKGNFDEAGGYGTYSELLLGSDGKLYGVLNSGGANGRGSIFSYDIATRTFTYLYYFTTSDGYQQLGGVTEFNGKLYGVKNGGGTNGTGIVYSLDLSNNLYQIIKSFDAVSHNTYPLTNATGATLQLTSLINYMILYILPEVTLKPTHCIIAQMENCMV
jgi:uncharacterized repeat protein (TIGR03803 family)